MYRDQRKGVCDEGKGSSLDIHKRYNYDVQPLGPKTLDIKVLKQESYICTHHHLHPCQYLLVLLQIAYLHCIDNMHIINTIILLM